MSKLKGFRLAFTVVGAASVFTMLVGQRDAAASDAFRSVKSALVQGASPVHNSLMPTRALVDPPSSPRKPQQSTKPIVTVQSLASAELQVPAEARLEEASASPIVAPVSDVRPVEAPAAAAAPSMPARRGPAPTEVAAYVARAHAKIQQGDIAAARRLLERASDSDEAEAWFALAETYDPQMLARWGVLGVKPDLEKAKTLYQKAEARGARGAQERLLALRE